MNLSTKLLWDIPVTQREEIAEELKKNPAATLRENEQLFIKALNSLKWYELTEIFDRDELIGLLSDVNLDKLFPPERRVYYKHARRLLSKYTVSASG